MGSLTAELDQLTAKRTRLLRQLQAHKNDISFLSVCLSVCLSQYVTVCLCSFTSESEELVEYRAELVRQLQAHKKYHQYMGKVLEAAGDFHENSEILSRYQTLLATYEVLYSEY